MQENEGNNENLLPANTGRIPKETITACQLEFYKCDVLEKEVLDSKQIKHVLEGV